MSAGTGLTTGIGLDVGEKRIGVARANLEARFATPVTTLARPESFIEDIVKLCAEEDAAWIVIGLPRGLDSQDTAQTQWVQAFGIKLTAAITKSAMPIPIYWTDEALTSSKAEAELEARGKPYAKGDIDALAATFILEDFLRENSAEQLDAQTAEGSNG